MGGDYSTPEEAIALGPLHLFMGEPCQATEAHRLDFTGSCFTTIAGVAVITITITITIPVITNIGNIFWFLNNSCWISKPQTP